MYVYVCCVLHEPFPNRTETSQVESYLTEIHVFSEQFTCVTFLGIYDTESSLYVCLLYASFHCLCILQKRLTYQISVSIDETHPGFKNALVLNLLPR